jgi:hypothetical protein
MNTTSELGPVSEPVTQSRRPSLTREHLEPWTANSIDLTLMDGSHRVGVLKSIDKGNLHLQVARGAEALPDGGIIRIVDTFQVKRAARVAL